MSTVRAASKGRIGVAALLLALVPTVSGGCSSPTPTADPSRPPATWLERTERDYVAMGDSYTSGAGIAPVADASCGRSRVNYPHLLAATNPTLELTDVSCAGARTVNLAEEKLFAYGAEAPLQFDALSPDVDLVTLSIGANDLNAFGIVVGECVQAGAWQPSGAPCATRYGDLGAQLLATSAPRIAAQVEGIRELSPQARIVLVGYPMFVPFASRCDALPLGQGDIGWARRVNEAMNKSLRTVAAETGVEFLDTAAVAEGHDACSSDPWFNPADPTLRADQPTDGRGDHIHPRPEYHAAVADALAELLATAPPSD